MSTGDGESEVSGIEYDIVMATDCSFPGGSTASVVEEIEAQHRAGYRTGLLHLPSPIQRSLPPFAERIRRVLEDGKAELIAGPRPVRTSLLLIRHPSVMAQIPTGLPPITTEHVLLVANQVPQDERGAAPYYDPVEVHRITRDVFGPEPTWAPIGPGVRAALEPSRVPMVATDWENIIDLEASVTPRTGFVSDRPVIGRHSRGHWSKWPESKEDLLAAYPANRGYQVRIMGGTEAPVGILGELPSNWVTLPFDAVPVPQFLAGIDFFVYFHHPGLVEAFGRVVLEALASGAVCVVPPELEAIFGDACHYGTPADVRPFVDALYADPQEFARRSQLGLDLVRDRFSYQAHGQRVAAIIGPPAGQPRNVAPTRSQGDGTVVLAIGADPQDLDGLDGVAGAAPIVVLTDRPAQQWGEQVLLESVPAVFDGQPHAAREADLRRRVAHLVRAHRATRVVVLAPDQMRHVTDLAEDVRVYLPDSAGTGPGAFLAEAVLRRRSPRAWARRASRRGMAMARRRAPRPVRRAGRWVVDTGRRVRRGVTGYTSVQNPTGVPVDAAYAHLKPNLPVVLLVVTTADVCADITLDAVLARAQAASSFRFAVLAPTAWAVPAAERDVTLETWVPEWAWSSTYTARWSEYARDRMTEVARLIRPVAVIAIDQTIDPGDQPASAHVLEVIEAASRARQ